MYMMYVDESGDPGLCRSPTKIFVLSGLVLHELVWRSTLDSLFDFRRRMRHTFGLKLREEIHAAPFINSPGALSRISRNNRLSILRHYADHIATLPDISIINIVVDKAGKPDDYEVHRHAWQALVQRFENTISYRNFPGPAAQDERGIVFADGDQSGHLVRMMRKMRVFNPVPNQPQYGVGYRNLPMTKIIEDPNFRDSGESLLIQSVDLVAYLLFQKHYPNSYFRKRGARGYFDRLDPVLCKHASRYDRFGVVRL